MSTATATAKPVEVLVVSTSSVVRNPSLRLKPPFSTLELQENAGFMQRNPKGLAGVGVTKVRTITPQDRLDYPDLPAEALYSVASYEGYFRAAVYARLQKLPVQVMEGKSSKAKPPTVAQTGTQAPATRPPQVLRTVTPSPVRPEPEPVQVRRAPGPSVATRIALSNRERRQEPTSSVPRVSQFLAPIAPPPPVVTMEDIVQLGPDTEWKTVVFKNPMSGRADMDKVSPRRFIQLWDAKLLQIPEGREDDYQGFLREAKKICAEAAK